MEDIIQICHRMLYLYNISLEEDSLSLNPIKYPTDYEVLRKATDYAINEIHYSNLSEEFKQIWLQDKFSYVAWVRDALQSQSKEISFVESEQ